MRIFNILLVSAAMTLAASCVKEPISGTMPDVPAGNVENPYLPGEVVIKFDPSLSDLLDKAGLSRTPATRSGVTTVDEILEIVDGYRLERVFPEVKATEAQSREAGLHLWYVVHFSEDEDVNEVVKKLSALGEVQSAAPVLTIKKSYNGKVIPYSPSARLQTRANGDEDPYFDLQWNLDNKGVVAGMQEFAINPDFQGDHVNYPDYPYDGKSAEDKFVIGDDINVVKAWAETEGDPSVIVAVLDEGICLVHEDLSENIWINEDEEYGSFEDNDGNGYAGDRYGYNFLEQTGIISWDDVGDSGHGTHVSGVIAAKNNNGKGISSIAGGSSSSTGVKLMSCQIFSGNSASNTVSLARAIKYAADNGAVILQCSFGYTSGTANPYEYGIGFRDEDEWAAGSPLEKSALDYFIHNAGSENGPVKGGLPVFASGNEYAPSAGFPGAYDDCIAVAAVAGDFSPSTFTNYGTYTDISAPGGDQDYYYDFLGANSLVDGDPVRGSVGCILSTVPEHVSSSGYGYMEGTSMACPHVSGAIALGISYAAQQHKHFTAEEIRELLYESCTPLNGYSGEKFYYKWQADASMLVHGRKMDLPSYNGKMGAGVVNVAAFLNKLAGSGVQMKFPNVYVQLGSSATVNPLTYFDASSYTVTIDSPSVAEVGVEGAEGSHSATVTHSGPFTFFGLAVGSTTATITPAGGEPQTFTITVSKSESGSGWL